MNSKRQRGFTLVEILIVVIILAVLAGVVIPQFSSSTEEAKLTVLRSDLSSMRKAVELYYHQHNAVYPGAVESNFSGDASPESWFVDQLTLYTNVKGEAVAVKNDIFKYGPYLKKGLPINPFNDLNTVTINKTDDKLTADTDDGAVDGSFIP
jgi:general secretion pathway protein G